MRICLLCIDHMPSIILFQCFQKRVWQEWQEGQLAGESATSVATSDLVQQREGEGESEIWGSMPRGSFS